MKRCFQPQSFPDIDATGLSLFTFSYDGSMILCTKSDTGQILLWEAESRAQSFKTVINTLYDIEGLLFSDDSKYILSAHEQCVFLFKKDGFRRVHKFEWERKLGKISSFSISPNNRWVIISTADPGCKMIRFDTETGKLVDTYPDCMSVIRTVFSNDSKYIVTGTRDGFIKIWDVESKSLFREIYTDDSVRAIAISSNKRWVASACYWENQLKIWDVETGVLLHVFDGYRKYSSNYTRVCLNGKCIVTCLIDGTIHFWEPTFGSFTALIIPLLQANLPPYVVLDIMNQLLAIVNHCFVDLEDKFNHGLKIKQIALLQKELGRLTLE